MRKIYLLMTMIAISLGVMAAPLRNVKVTLTQPDGQVINCFASGDEFYNYLHDENGFTIVRADNGYLVYATKDSKGQVIPSEFVVNTVDPASVGLQPNIRISSEEYYARRHEREQYIKQPKQPEHRETNHGLYNNLVVFIRFAGDTYHNTHFSAVDSMFNADNYESSSLHNYYHRSTYNQLDLWSYFYPQPDGEVILSYEDIYPKQYYQPYHPVSNPMGYQDGETAEREFGMLERAIAYVEDMVPDTLDLDYNDDGLVDNVVFVIKGEPGEWASLLWPHRWSIYDRYVPLHDLQVYDFNLQLEIGDYFTVGVLCHEMCHSLGAPDLYHYSTGIDPAGAWDLMCGTSNPPQQEGIYMKYKYGYWVDEIPDITDQYGTYELEAVTWEGNRRNAYKIRTDNPYQFFVIEYRDKSKFFDNKIPGSGLLMYRIDTRYNGGAGYNGIDTFDEVYIFRPDGSIYQAGDLDHAHFSAESGRTAFNSHTNPYFFFTNGNTPNWDTFIYNISPTGRRMSFTYGVTDGPVPTHFIAHVNSIEHQIELVWEAVENANSYNIYRDGEVIAQGITDPSYIHPYTEADNGYHIYGVCSVSGEADEHLSDPAEQWIILGDFETINLSLTCDSPYGTKGGEVEAVFDHPNMKPQYFTIYEGLSNTAEIYVPAGTQVTLNWLPGFDPEGKGIHVTLTHANENGQGVLFDADEPTSGPLAVHTASSGALGIITPQNLSATPENGNTRLRWTVPTENNLFCVYRDDIRIESHLQSYDYLDERLLQSGCHRYLVADVADDFPWWEQELLATVMTFNCEPPQNLQGVHHEGSQPYNELTWEAPQFIGHGMLAYDNNQYLDKMGSKNQKFGIKINPEFLSSFEGLPLTHIEMFDCSAGNYTFKIYNGDNVANNTLLYSQSYEMSGSQTFVRFPLDEEVSYDATIPVWIVAEPSNVEKPVPYGTYVGNDNGCMVRVNSNWRPITDFDQYHTWLLRAYTGANDTNNDFTYNVYVGPEEANDYEMNVGFQDLAAPHVTHDTNENIRYNVTAIWNGKETNFSNSVFLGPSVEITELAHSSLVTIFPNPAKDQLTIRAKGMSQVTVMNLLGQELERMSIKGDEAVLNLSHYDPALYLLRIVTENGTFVEHIVKEF